MIDEMNVSGVQHLIERAYRESGELQYVRELYKNAEEAGATRVVFQPEWQAVEQLGVYRLAVVDDGKGMEPDDLRTYLNTFGGGGKPIGEAHENYGIGAKTSTLPWNKAGLVVISYTEANPEGAMLWLCHDEKSGRYGARRFELADGTYDSVVQPFDDDEAGIDWTAVKPDWLETHGTVVVLMGNTGREHTFVTKDGESLDVKAYAAYLNKRNWEIPEHLEVLVQELRSSNPDSWPRSFEEASGPAEDDVDRRYNQRQVRGARHFVEDVTASSGELAHSGELELSDGTTICWYLWEGDRPHVHSYAHRSGFIAALYKDELYDVKTHHASFRRWGINQSAVRKNLFLIAVPPQLDGGGYGVYPDTARNALRIKGNRRAGEALPWDEWGDEFARNLPAPIVAALRATVESESGTLSDDRWSERLASKFSDRWKRWTRMADASGTTTVDAADSGAGSTQRPRPTRTSGTSAGGGGASRGQGNSDGPLPARRTKVTGGVPDYQWLSADEIEEQDVAAVWNPPSAANPNGMVQLNEDFRPVAEVVEHWQAAYPEHLADSVRKTVHEVYGEAMCARIAHSETLARARSWGSKKVEDELRSPAALTMAALGLVLEDSIIAQRLGGQLGAGSRRETA